MKKREAKAILGELAKYWSKWPDQQRQSAWGSFTKDEQNAVHTLFDGEGLPDVDDPEPLDVGTYADIAEAMNAMCSEPESEPSPCARVFVLEQVTAGEMKLGTLVTIWAALHNLDYCVARDGVYVALAKLRVDGSVIWDGCEFSSVKVK